jgi:hypothetical protein
VGCVVGTSSRRVFGPSRPFSCHLGRHARHRSQAALLRWPCLRTLTELTPNARGELRAKRASVLAVSSSAVLDAAQRLQLTRTLHGILEPDRLDTPLGCRFQIDHCVINKDGLRRL